MDWVGLCMCLRERKVCVLSKAVAMVIGVMRVLILGVVERDDEIVVCRERKRMMFPFLWRLGGEDCEDVNERE